MAATIYDSLRWRAARVAALNRDGECQVRRLLGGACSHVLHVHHVVRPEDGGALYDLDNLIVVCERHHPQLEALRRFVFRKRHRDRNAARAERHASAIEEAEVVAQTWAGNREDLNELFDGIERRYRVTLGFFDRERLVSYSTDESLYA